VLLRTEIYGTRTENYVRFVGSAPRFTMGRARRTEIYVWFGAERTETYVGLCRQVGAHRDLRATGCRSVSCRDRSLMVTARTELRASCKQFGYGKIFAEPVPSLSRISLFQGARWLVRAQSPGIGRHPRLRRGTPARRCASLEATRESFA
jgi:hypothetical protein